MKCQQLGHLCVTKSGFAYSDMYNNRDYQNNYEDYRDEEYEDDEYDQEYEDEEYEDDEYGDENNFHPDQVNDTYEDDFYDYYDDYDYYRPSYVAPTVSNEPANESSGCVIL